MTLRKNALFVSHDEKRPDRLAFPAAESDLDGKIHDRVERFQRDRRVELTQIRPRQTIQMLFQRDERYRVDRVRLKPAVHRDDLTSRTNVIFGDRDEQSLHEAVVDRISRHFQNDGLQTGFLCPLRLFFRIDRNDKRDGIPDQLPNSRPVGLAVVKHDDRGGFHLLKGFLSLPDEKLKLFGNAEGIGHDRDTQG